MKKFTSLLMAVLVAAVSFAGGPVRKSAPVNALQMGAPRHLVPNKKVMPLSHPTAQTSLSQLTTSARKKAPRKVSSISELTGKYILASMVWDIDAESNWVPAEPAMSGNPVSLKQKDATTIAISGFISEATEDILATVDLAKGTFTIADEQLLFTDDEYGPILLANAENEAPITGTINEDGSIELNELWYAIIGGDSDDAGDMWSEYCYESTLAPVNGTMTWQAADDEGGVEILTKDVLIVQNPERHATVTVFNFGGDEVAVNISLKEDKTFVIESQLVFDYGSLYGQFYTFGLSDDGKDFVTLTGKGTEKTLTFDCNWTYYSSVGYWWGLQGPATITLTDNSEFIYPLIEDVAAMPANPKVLEVSPYDSDEGYGYVLFEVPAKDVDGNPIKESRLFYQLFSDVAGDIQPITFSSSLYKNLDQDLSIVPYTLNDSYDFDLFEGNKLVYLNFQFAFDRIGIKSIYTGGDVTNETDIQWFDIDQSGEEDELTFDFNNMDVPVSTNTSHDGDITEALTLTGGKVSLTVSPAEEGVNTPNRFWLAKDGTQLRVYSGTLTFTVPEGMTINAIEFNAGKWNDNNTADSGEFDGTTWTGNAQSVTIYIAGNTQLNGIAVTVGEGEPVTFEPVVAPKDLVTDTYLFKAMVAEYDSDDDGNPLEPNFVEYENQVTVGFDGDDLYIQGFSTDVPEGWVKATKNENGQYVVPANQFMGSIDYFGLITFNFFFTAVDEEENLIDAVFSVDTEAKTITSRQTLVINGDQDAFFYYILYKDVVLSKLQEIAAAPADPAIVRFSADDELKTPYVGFDIPAKSVDGQPLITKYLFYQIFIEKNGEVQPLTLTAGLYQKIEEDMTVIPYDFDDDYDFYRGGKRVYLNQELEEIHSWSQIGVQSINTAAGETHKSNVVWMKINDIADRIAGMNANSQKTQFFDLSGRAVSVPQKGLFIKQMSQQDGSVKAVKVLIK